MKQKDSKRDASPGLAGSAKPRCGLCGATKKLARTPCCGEWICNDEDEYVLFSYARNSCSRNHRRYTLCGFHSGEGHAGDWKSCQKCRESFQTEMYVWYGTNEYNFTMLVNPPAYEPTHCDQCGVVIRLGIDGYSIGPEGTLCERCNHARYYSQRTPAKKGGPKPGLPPNPEATAIEILVSATVRSRWRLKPQFRASDPAAHWLAQWRVDLFQKADRSRWLLATNAATLYTFVLKTEEARTREQFEKLFRIRLGFALVDAPTLAPWRSAPLTFVLGNARPLIGSMNDMKRLLSWRTDEEATLGQDDEAYVNEVPFSALKMGNPLTQFSQHLRAKG